MALLDSLVINFQDIDSMKLMVAGGKGVNLAALYRLPDVQVPHGFCVSTEAFKMVMNETSAMIGLLNQLTALHLDDRHAIKMLSAEIRKVIEEVVIQQHIKDAVSGLLTDTGSEAAYAIRSSATAEDMPTASFAGQQDTYLNVIGVPSILNHIRKCWASLFTERAIIYRIQHGFDHRKVLLAVIVQKMVFPQVSGVMFTADPVNGNRKVVSIDASFGLGEAIVSGIVNTDVYKVIDGRIADKKIVAKKIAIRALKDGGTKEEGLSEQEQMSPSLSNNQILELAALGRNIEAYFGSPQDIEWCLSDDVFYIVQSRPITTLYPIPEVDDKEHHVFISVGHNQMMTDAMKPLGLSFFLLTTMGKMYQAGGRLFVDIMKNLSSATSRKALMDTLGKSDPLIKDALMTLMDREDFLAALPKEEDRSATVKNDKELPSNETGCEHRDTVVATLIERSQSWIANSKLEIQLKTGLALFDFILEDIRRLKEISFDPQGFRVFMAAIDASAWVNEKINNWLGEKNVADILTQSVPNNITSEMGLELMDVADEIRPYKALVDYLQQEADNDFPEKMLAFEGGDKAQRAIYSYLNKYGMRCAGEIDITKTRWAEKPLTLLPAILNNIKNFEPGTSKQRFEDGRQKALNKEADLLNRLKQLPDGIQKANETKQKIDTIRNFMGYREYPKYGIVNAYFIYKQALLKEATKLVLASVIKEEEDVYYLSFEEFREVVRSHTIDYQIISERKEAFRQYERLTPPRVITSDGEIISGSYKHGAIPEGGIAGLAVSSGIIEGRARVVLNMEDAELEDGDILITTFTDPSWTPLFVSIKGLVTEVGGLMTHGAVVAREYGLPAVVGVEGATRLIIDGQRIRVNGTEGYVEII